MAMKLRGRGCYSCLAFMILYDTSLTIFRIASWLASEKYNLTVINGNIKEFKQIKIRIDGYYLVISTF